MKKVKERLKHLREKFGRTKRELSEATGIKETTIDDIEAGAIPGNELEWALIEAYFDYRNNGNGVIYSYDSDELINEVKEDIELYGENTPCFIIYEIIDDRFIFTDYGLIGEDDFELQAGERKVQTTLSEALEIFEKQNKI